MHAEWQLKPDDIQALQLDRQIGEGSYGKVYRATLPGSSVPYAVKVVEIDADQDDAVKLKETPGYRTMEQEISILKNCADCPQIVRVFGVGVRLSEDSRARVMIVMELCEHGSVSDIMRHRLNGALRESEIRVIVREVLMGLKYLHDDKKIHRDVKAGNILLTKQFSPKLADFGISCELQNTCAKRQTMIGSPYWMAPEVIQAGFGYNSGADIWSLGITCVEMAEMQPPYYHIPQARAMFVITTKPPRGLQNAESEKQFSEDFTGFLSACLTVDPKERPSATALLVSPLVQRRDDDLPAAQALEASLGPRLAEASRRTESGDRGRSASWQRRPSSQSLLARVPSGNSLGATQQSSAPSLEAATPSVDAFADATMTMAGTRPATSSRTSASSPSLPPRRWNAEEGAGSGPAAALSSEEIRRRARDWVNRTVPMETVEDDMDSPIVGKTANTKAPVEVWDSDDEGVETCTRVEAQPEAGAGGPSGGVPFFMQVLNKQWGG
mmetsp:Transcript_52717/g.151972  ORF Transcript_52717/g.151972 Transcript_52717/m.151972 type:complete len:498 (-) Transcript_52717:136-1629(-)